MTKNFKISIRYKMSTAYGFHMDFQFWVHLTMLGGFQMLQSPRITKLDLEQPEMVQNQIFLFQRLDFEYTQLLPSPVLKNLKSWTFWTPLLGIMNVYLHPPASQASCMSRSPQKTSKTYHNLSLHKNHHPEKRPKLSTILSRHLPMAGVRYPAHVIFAHCR